MAVGDLESVASKEEIWKSEAETHTGYESLTQRKYCQPAFDLRFQLLPVEDDSEGFLTLTPSKKIILSLSMLNVVY